MQKDLKKKPATLILPECSFHSCVQENRVPQKRDAELKKTQQQKVLDERLLDLFHSNFCVESNVPSLPI